MERQFGKLRLELMQGDITRQSDLDAVVNAANAQLTTGGGVAGAIHRAAGPQLDEACRPLAPIEPGQAVSTDAFGLPNQRLIHCLGPVYGVDEPSDQLLAACYRNALKEAGQHQLGSVGFPAISTGAFGYPVREAAGIALQTVVSEGSVIEGLTLVRFVLFSNEDLAVHEEILARMA
ncbi:macro domain-containing protein [Natronospira sp.]|uniref:macro domain-containing protein n=1 Tax=Natronospira sp. TaxID=2024970 RepID=UPI003872B90F